MAKRPGALRGAEEPPDGAQSIWSELSDRQRATILDALGVRDVPSPVSEISPAERYTMRALSTMNRDDSQPATQLPDTADAAAAAPSGTSGTGGVLPNSGYALWRWDPADNALVTTNFDPNYIVGGAMSTAGTLVCQQVKVPAGRAITAVLLDVVAAGEHLTRGGANLAAIYEDDGRRTGITADQADEWTSAGPKRMQLRKPVAPRPDPRTVWVGFIAAGRTSPSFSVSSTSPAARPNLGLPSPGPQRAGRLLGQTACPAAIDVGAMTPDQQYWVGLA